ncbi:unnamed protein product [Commensalibacter communis]|uniref:hypothetical protein n=1 Tax=Commensalibacter communis TaxID=2972786 RepID=UPI0022FF6927|nr:hypothetical protein [Commensalibacter communis]CAI3937988.1 unnamed protein product [Commensalibacter communis]CAI3939198.1 unnamed protein product [Commensalibacter communis]
MQCIDVVVDRDSVCMADDIVDHRRNYSCSVKMTMHELLTILSQQYDLPRISGGKACWVVATNRPLICAVVAQEENYRPRYIISSITPILHMFLEDQDSILHFNYLIQDKPSAIFKKIQQGYYKEMRWNNLHWDSR